MLNHVSSISTPNHYAIQRHSFDARPACGLDDIIELLNSYSSLPLASASAINLNARFDAKFLLPIGLLRDELILLKKHFIVQLNAGNAPISQYTTRYWDSAGYSFFLDHATSRSHRMKVRKRSYDDTGECFLEIKKKRHDKTLKIRIPTQFTNTLLEQDRVFLKQQGVDPDNIKPVLDVRYRRVTLWDIGKQGRITIDLDYEVGREDEKASFPGVAIIEIKGTKKYITHTSKQFHIPLQRYRTGFSKYGMGVIKLNQYKSSEAKELFRIYKRLIKFNADV